MAKKMYCVVATLTMAGKQRGGYVRCFASRMAAVKWAALAKRNVIAMGKKPKGARTTIKIHRERSR